MISFTEDRGLNWCDKSVLVSGVDVADASRDDLVQWLSGQRRIDGPLLAYALHIGGLVHLREQPDFLETMNLSSVVYADGIATVLLGRARGGSLERSATTDIAPSLLATWSESGQLPRIAMLGGPAGLAEDAGRELERLGLGTIVFTGTGFGEDWNSRLDAIRDSEPEILFVGMGAPQEMLWCEANLASLPDCIVMTCGGWFGFLAGNETRAPKWLQNLGGEWIWRLAQNPRRLARRYSKGLLALGHGMFDGVKK